MEISGQYHYEFCQNCKYAEFSDFENLKCLQQVKYNSDKNCGKFAEIEQENSQNLLVNGKFNKIVEEIQQENEKSIKTSDYEIIEIKNNHKSEDTRDEIDYRFFTLDDVDVYDTTDIIFSGKLRTIPKNTLVPFHREIIRHGFELLMMKESDGTKTYVEKDLKKITICDQCQSRENHLDIILMPHNEFDKTVENTKLVSIRMDADSEKIINSHIGNEKQKTIVKIIDKIKKDGKVIELMSLISFNKIINNIKIGRLEPHTKFYITSSKGDKYAKKIKTDDGTEGILISNTEAYKVILPALQQFVNFIVIALTIVIVLGIIYSVLEATGWIIVIGIAVIIIAYLVAILIGGPVYIILNQIIKRL